MHMRKIKLGDVTLEICEDRKDCWDYVRVTIGNIHLLDICTTDPSGLVMTKPGEWELIEDPTPTATEEQ